MNSLKNKSCETLYDTVIHLRNNIDTLLKKLVKYEKTGEIKLTHSNYKDLEKLGFLVNKRSELSLTPIGKEYVSCNDGSKKEAIKRVQILFYNFSDIYPFWILLFILNEYKQLSREQINDILNIKLEYIEDILNNNFDVIERIEFLTKDYEDQTETFGYVSNFIENTGLVEIIKDGRRKAGLKIIDKYQKFINRLLKNYPKIDKEKIEEIYKSNKIDYKIRMFLSGRR